MQITKQCGADDSMSNFKNTQMITHIYYGYKHM